MVFRFLSTFEGVEIKTDGVSALSRSLGEHKLDVTRQRLWYKSSSGTCEWNSAGSVAGVLPGPRTHESESQSWYTVVSMDVAAFSLDGGALPVRSKNETHSA